MLFFLFLWCWFLFMNYEETKKKIQIIKQNFSELLHRNDYSFAVYLLYVSTIYQKVFFFILCPGSGGHFLSIFCSTNLRITLLLLMSVFYMHLSCWIVVFMFQFEVSGMFYKHKVLFLAHLQLFTISSNFFSFEDF